MYDLLIYLDKMILAFINQTISNPVLDLLMPYITDWNKFLIVQIVLLFGIIFLIAHQGPKGRVLIILIMITILVSDQVSSSVIKPLVARPRPCHILEGNVMVENIRLLVSCGPGYSFPSSHAVNHFAVAIILSKMYSKFKPYLFSFATLVAFSRVYIGVHYPFDVFAGAIIGIIIALLIYEFYSRLSLKYFRKYHYAS